jgi:hypothetical protein
VGTRGFDPVATERTTDDARRGRSLLEAALARFPGVFPGLARLMLGFPHSGIRRALLRYAVRRGYSAFNRGDWELNTIVMDPERYELVNTDPTRDMIGMASSVGVSGYVETMQGWRDSWDAVSVSLAPGTGVREVGSRGFLTIDRWQGHLAGSGMTLDLDMASVYELERGRVVTQTLYWDVDQALAEHGVKRS